MDTRFLAPGSRMALDLTYPPMSVEDAGILVGALGRAESEEVLYPWPQPGLVIGAPGVRTMGLDVSANARVIAVAGNTTAYLARAGQFFNIIAPDGRRYLHYGTQPANLPGNMRIVPATRLEVPAGWSLDFATPMIQASSRVVVPLSGTWIPRITTVFRSPFGSASNDFTRL